MNEHNQRLIARMLEAFRLYQASEISLPEFQGEVDGALGAVEGLDELERMLRWLAAELETIRFMSPEDEHVEEVARIMVRFRGELPLEE